MPKDDHLQFDGTVVAARGNGNFLIRIDETENEVSCVLSGKIRKNSIRILEGDRVKIEVSVYDMSKGIVTFRSKAGEQLPQ
jgi:translation initiation factor IF-1